MSQLTWEVYFTVLSAELVSAAQFPGDPIIISQLLNLQYLKEGFLLFFETPPKRTWHWNAWLSKYLFLVV